VPTACIQTCMRWQDSKFRNSFPLCLQAIVFSQFWMHLQLIAATLTAGGCRFAMLQAHLKPDAKAQALQCFQDDPACSELPCLKSRRT